MKPNLVKSKHDVVTAVSGEAPISILIIDQNWLDLELELVEIGIGIGQKTIGN